MGGELDTQAREQAIARLAARQHGALTRGQLLGAGLGEDAIDSRLKRGRLRRVHRGVYLLGPTVPDHAREMAGVLACGPGAVSSHRSAAFLWSLLHYPARARGVEVTVAGRNPASRPGITVHRVRELSSIETTTKHGIPVTTPARTLLDLASSVAPRGLEQAVAEAFAHNLTTRPKLLSLVERRPRHRGARHVIAVLEADRAPARTRSPPEERLLSLIREAKLPHPEVNAVLDLGEGQRGHLWEVDFLWRKQRLAVEVDAYATHSSPFAFERDRRKTAELLEAGFRVLPVSRRRLRAKPGAVLASIKRALS